LANLRLLGDCLLWAVFLKLKNSPIFFFYSKTYDLIATRMVWALFWATFSQTHPVTLLSNHLFTVADVSRKKKKKFFTEKSFSSKKERDAPQIF
jgi:hypothetical protein